MTVQGTGAMALVMAVVISLIALVVIAPLSLEMGKRGAKADSVNRTKPTIAPT